MSPSVIAAERITAESKLQQLARLAQQFDTVKCAEDATRAERIKIEEAIALLVPGPDKGQKTVELTNGKLVVKRDLIFKADCDKIRSVMFDPLWPPPIKSKTAWTLDEVGFEWYKKHKPEIFKALSTFVEVKPKKTAVTFKRKA